MSGMSRVGKRANAFEYNGKLKKINQFSLFVYICMQLGLLCQNLIYM